MIVSALPQEIIGLEKDVLITGVGKINATRVLVDYIIKQKPKQIINYGTAAKCSRRVEVGKIYEIKKFIQRDMNATQLGFETYQTPFGKGAINTGLVLPSNLVCGTGDNFWEGDSQFTAEYDVADMEAYALASVCEEYKIRFRCFKYISDDGNADQWIENCKKGVKLFKEYVNP
jgi:adenosylhomocysteine nucleosidase|tara:strand:- start:856 stop:1377 length:522 start_codon:yes stop_codon:yes gene_type:complete